MRMITMLALIGVLGTIALVRPAPAQDVGTPAAGQIDGLETFEDVSTDHTEETVDYDQDPPAGGPHNPVWQNCGFYKESVRNEHAVHSQEHGAVWVTYGADLAEEDLARLRRLADRNDYLLVSPYPALPAPLVASAWGARVELEGVDDPRLRDFVRQFAEQGPEPGAPCTGGTDETFPLGPPAAATPAATPAP